ncbi:MAG: type II 3-dehydroquinate dehydratase [Oscillospiraceae bacterium]|jgi:3-dehydroquinate dehydratase-2|nr:type II 3-dehydroquinate dehydratase [Oscillospiraceae bacterium]MBR6430580.1 type II 3-dehydroquinate dehydratase [Oscillospiraceae bacterium]
MKILIINGPNLNMLGIREPGVYGTESYADLVRYLETACAELGVEAEVWQSNHEGAIVDKIQQAYGTADAIVINPAAYTHYSIAILDALKAVSLPAVEVHLSDIYQREPFRHVSYPAMACEKSVYGKGFAGYREAIEYLFAKYG